MIDILTRSSLIYIFILVILRLSQKRQISQMTPIDLVIILLISNSVQNAMTGPDTTLMGGVVSAGTLFIMNFIFSKCTHKFKWFRHLVEGTPSELIKNGQLIKPNLEKENINNEELLQILREHSVENIEDVKLAVLEVDGTLSIIYKDSTHLHRNKRKVRFYHH